MHVLVDLQNSYNSLPKMGLIITLKITSSKSANYQNSSASENPFINWSLLGLRSTRTNQVWDESCAKCCGFKSGVCDSTTRTRMLRCCRSNSFKHLRILILGLTVTMVTFLQFRRRLTWNQQHRVDDEHPGGGLTTTMRTTMRWWAMSSGSSEYRGLQESAGVGSRVFLVPVAVRQPHADYLQSKQTKVTYV